MIKYFFLIIVALGFYSNSASGQLSWESKQSDVTPVITDIKANAVYSFKNVGNYSILIQDIKTSCGCTTAKLAKKAYAPGESGRIDVQYDIGTNTGLQQKQIYVTTDERTNEITQLTMRIFLPQMVTLTPPSVSWKLNEDKTPKKITIDVLDGHEINILDVRSSNDLIFTQIHTVIPHKKYLLTVTPVSTVLPAEAELEIQTDYPTGRPKVINGLADIKPKS
jgi:hypothetical protein